MITIGRRGLFFSVILGVLLGSCSTGTPQTTPQAVSVSSSYSARPWLTELYDCAAQSSAIIRLSDSPSAPDIRLQIGEPELLTGFAYQIDTENIVVIMNNARPPKVNLQQITGMFTGQITNLNQITSGWGNVHTNESGEIHVWVYSSDNDIQQLFNKIVLEDRPFVSSARLAITPDEMLVAIRNDSSSIGILPQRWNPNREVFEQAVVATVPVLAITKDEPQGVIKQLIGCLQK